LPDNDSFGQKKSKLSFSSYFQTFGELLCAERKEKNTHIQRYTEREREIQRERNTAREIEMQRERERNTERDRAREKGEWERYTKTEKCICACV
jgi:hypothetical protein